VKKTRTKKTPPKTSARAATRRRAPAKAKKTKVSRRVSPPPEIVIAEPIPEVSVAVENTPSAPLEEIVAAEPEREFAARTLAAEPDRPVPAARRAIFFDVENTSRAEHIARVIDHLAVDRLGRRTDFVAVGNWKVIGQDTARLLARHGAQLVHSAPSVGVRDWSDLRIAVAAGVWLAAARAGDVMEIVTNDRAFDAVGDVAAGLGITFRRLVYQGLVGAPAPPPAEEPVRDSGSGRRRRRGRRYGWRESGGPAAVAPPVEREARAPSRQAVPAVPVAPPPAVAPELPRVEVGGNGAESPAAAPHTAPHDEIVAVVREMIHRSPARAVSLDTLANALKSRGFSRTPGSPRLITRLRRIKEITVSRSGMITLIEAGARESQRDAPIEASPARPAPVEAPAVRFEHLAEDVETSSEPVEVLDDAAEAAPERIESTAVTAAGNYDDMEEPGDSVGNVAPPAAPSPPPRYQRPHRGDRRRFPRPQQRAGV
jgi:hypothetical protein